MIIDYNTRSLSLLNLKVIILEICIIPPWELEKINSNIKYYSSNAFQIMEPNMIDKYEFSQSIKNKW